MAAQGAGAAGRVATSDWRNFVGKEISWKGHDRFAGYNEEEKSRACSQAVQRLAKRGRGQAGTHVLVRFH